MPPRAADQLIAQARGRRRPSGFATRSSQIADLELASRGGRPRGLGEDTAALLAVLAIASGG